MHHDRPQPCSSRLLAGFVILLLVGVAISWAADAPAPPSHEALIPKLQAATGLPIVVETKAGDRYARATLLRITFDAKKNALNSITIQDSAANKPRTLGFASIRSLILDREKVYEAPATATKTAADIRAQKLQEQEAEEHRQWMARAQANGVKPWPELTKEQHEEALESYRKFIEKVQQALPSLAVYETEEFLFCSNIPKQQIAPYTQALDAMHDLMCKMYGIKPGEPVWKGKCVVMAFLTREEFDAFERTFMDNDQGSGGAYGRCHSDSNGRVIIACHRGEEPEDFAKMLVHETSHGFIHRYRTAVRPPAWVNEGMADWIGYDLVPASQSVPRRQQLAVKRMRKSHSMEGTLTENTQLEQWQYGLASSLTDFLLRADAQAYKRFIQGIKEGLTWQESLQAAYNRTPEQLVTAYGEAIGVPDLEAGSSLEATPRQRRKKADDLQP